jgi:hypothetical protein
MKKFAQYPLLFLMLIIGQNAFAQEASKISGQIKEATGKGLPFANISLIEDSSKKLITGTVTDENGKFSFLTNRTGSARLVVSSIGFQTFTSESFEIKEGAPKDFGSIDLKEEVASLKEVTVKSTRPEVIVEADKTIVNVAGTVMAEGNNALDVVGRSPGVYVDADGNINLNGRSGVIVMIDDRPTYMSANDLANFLRAMPADNIKSIEVISTPGARFDAEGGAGIINIKLKKNTIDGLFGSINAGGRYNGLFGPFAGSTLNVKKGKWATTGNLNYSEFAFLNSIDINRKFYLPLGISEFDQSSTMNMRFKNLMFNGGTDYQINKDHSVGLGLQLSNHNGNILGRSITEFNNPGSSDVNYLRALNDNPSENQRLYVNLHYIGKVDSIGSKLTSDVDFTVMDAGSQSLLTNNNWINQNEQNASTDYLRSLNSMLYYIFTAKVDYSRPLGKGKSLDTGLKGSWMKSDNDLQMFTSTSGEPFMPDSRSNAFIYHENILAAYATYKSPITKSINFQGGVRAEYSDILGNSVTMGQLNPQKYLNLFPSAFVSQKISKSYQINYSANRRINRPNYRLLNPYIHFIDPMTSERGNPHLRPQYSYNFEMNHVIKGAFQLSTGYSRTENAFQQIFEQNEETRHTTVFTTNLDNVESYNFKAIIPWQFAKWYNMSNMLQVNHNKFKSWIGDALLDVQQTSFMIRTQHNIILPKSYRLEVIGMYMGPQLMGQGLIRSLGWMDAGVTKSLMKDKMTLTVNATDVFASQIYRARIKFDNIDAGFSQYRNTQAVRVTMRYNFSKGEKFKVNSRSGSTEERNRLE